jgi:hypothetical protein
LRIKDSDFSILSISFSTLAGICAKVFINKMDFGNGTWWNIFKIKWGSLGVVPHNWALIKKNSSGLLIHYLEYKKFCIIKWMNPNRLIQ